jgi:hypothetical protein
MYSDQKTSSEITANVCQITTNEITQILRARVWIASTENSEADDGLKAWLQRAADLLGPQVSNGDALAELLTPIFVYDANEILKLPANQDVMSRTGARDVIRELANRIFDGGDLDSDRFKEIVDGIKDAVSYRSRAMFHPIRVALIGRAGEGELDRVILLLDSAAKLNFTVPVKSTRQRMLEFCAAFD